MRRFAAATVALFLFAFYANAEELRGRMGRSSGEVPQASKPPLRAASLAAAPRVATLERTLDADVAAMRAWNDAGQVPSRIGIIRELKQSVAVRAISTMASSKPWQWRGTVHVDGATRTRLKLRDVTLPSSAKLWVYGDGDAISFTPANTFEGELWTPSVTGNAITLEVESSSGSFTIASVADIRDDIVATGTECFQSVACQSQAMRDVGTAIARYEVPASPGFVSLCSGGLIFNSAGTFEPYFLTANHCLSTQAEASGAEVFWDYRPSTCGGVPPSLASVPRTNGATLLVTSDHTDVTLLRLSSVPGERVYLGWNTRVLAFGEQLRRVSHPSGNPQVFSTTTVNVDEDQCAAIPRGRFIYSNRLVGGVSSGSSGSPVFIEDGIIVGQLFGKCGTKLSDDCSVLNYSVDGALRESFPLLQPFINPQVTCNACVPNNNTACMLGGRFKVTMPTWRDTFANLTGQGSLVKYTDNLPEIHPEFGPVSESAFFSMYSHAPKSIEALVRIIKGQNINNKYWVFLMGFTGAEYTIHIEDTQTCRTWQRTIPVGATAVIKDFDAFPF